jgi:hypothetical protein
MTSGEHKPGLHAHAQQGGLNLTLKLGATSVLLRDALRRPLAELELGELDASLRRVDSHVTRARALHLLHATHKPLLAASQCGLAMLPSYAVFQSMHIHIRGRCKLPLGSMPATPSQAPACGFQRWHQGTCT